MATLPSRAPALAGKAGPGEGRANDTGPKRLSLYAYSFWRNGGGAPLLAPAAQYGGSQSALIATRDLGGAPERGPALLLRASATPDGKEKEAALGVRWQRLLALPLSLTGERRFRLDGRDRFAAYLAGGVDALPVAAGFDLDAFGQAGWASGKGGGGFYDAQARLTKPVLTLAGLPVRAGLGGWSGGQKGVQRLDVGPTLSTRIDTRLTRFDLRLDWRQRVAGEAKPGNGLALTVSTGF